MPLRSGTAFAPGQFVRHPDRPDWGLGQVQSAVGSRVTVSFENAGKVLVDALVVRLEEIPEADLDSGTAGPRSSARRG
ncbi:MAG: DUF3553 domain-containing protein [Rhodospirillales bacterium]|nr:DUF3553 domain-containing protein [Rhodospirillales bacterium]